MKKNIIWLLAKITFKEGIRSNLLYGIALLSLFLFIINLFITQLFAIEMGKVAIDVGFSILSLAGLSIIFFMGIGLLSKDIHQKHICMIISHPVSRWEYVVGKFSGLGLFLVVAIGMLGLFAAISLLLGTQIVGGLGLPRNFSWAMLCATVFFNFLSLLVILAVGFLFTVITSSVYISMLLTFFVYIIGNTLETIIKVLQKGDFVQTGDIFINGLKVVEWLFPNLAAFDLKTSLAYGLPVDITYLSSLTAYGIFYICIILVTTTIILNRKDI